MILFKKELYMGYFFTILSSILIFSGWMMSLIIIDHYGIKQTNYAYLSEILSTTSMIMINFVNYNVLSDTDIFEFDKGYFGQGVNQFLFVLACLCNIFGLAGAIEISVISIYSGKLNTGITCLLSNILIIASSLSLRYGTICIKKHFRKIAFL
ncbi:hypothetical protein A3Q56_02222 [Intoshia linei]|uniref:Uncharacterized protein n=1 Tax=Intoshia linei TaxID=1819745 RepID=A0A177B8K8_9BILA|nr:hypothetical protein A3Q56_02222 [Intoshia linei]